MKKRAATIVAAALCLLCLAMWLALRAHDHFSAGADELILLVPDGASFSDPRVTVWLDAASEEGLHVIPMHDSAFLRPLFGRPKCAGVILPDSIHQQASDLLVGELRDYVANGGNLMLVFDAATKSIQGFYPSARSRLSDLAGVDYALYKNLGNATIRSGDVSSTIPLMKQLGVPPGKFFPFFGPFCRAREHHLDSAQALSIRQSGVSELRHVGRLCRAALVAFQCGCRCGIPSLPEWLSALRESALGIP